MDIKELFSGIAVVIDDALKPDNHDNTDNIKTIVEIFDKNNIPVISYYEIPTDEIVKNWKNISFLLIDWELNPLSVEDINAGVKLPDSSKNEIISFLKKIQDYFFIPVFIFSKEDINTIKSKLIENRLVDPKKSNFIFLKSKTELVSKENPNKLFEEIENWVKQTPSIYVLKEWERELIKAKNQLFWNFYNINPGWPNIIWEAYKDDSVDMSTELNELLNRNLRARFNYYEFEKEILENISISNAISTVDLRNVIEGERYIKNPDIKEIRSGDIFKIKEHENDKNEIHYINIRPDCDLVPRNVNLDDLDVYLLKCDQLEEPVSQNKCDAIFKEGHFKETDTNIVIFPVEGKIFKVFFKNLVIKKYGVIKEYRIGRLLPPYITRLQQRYSLYLQRQGLPRTPEKAVFQKGTADN